MTWVHHHFHHHYPCLFPVTKLDNGVLEDNNAQNQLHEDGGFVQTPKEEEGESTHEMRMSDEQPQSKATEPDQEAASASQAAVSAAEPGPTAGTPASLPAAEGSHTAKDTTAAASPAASPAAVQSVQEAPGTEQANKCGLSSHCRPGRLHGCSPY